MPVDTSGGASAPARVDTAVALSTSPVSGDKSGTVWMIDGGG